jgi:hypothetical protein
VRPRDHVEQRVVERVPVRLVQPRQRDHADQRAGHAAHRQPLRERRVDVTLLPHAPAAERLGHRAVGEVGADRHRRLDAREQDEQRRHERAAADPGQADQDPDPQAEEDDERIHGGAG